MVCKVKPIEHLEQVSTRLAQKHPDLHLLDKIKQRLAHLEPANLKLVSTLAIAVSLQSPNYVDGLQEKDPPFQAWKQASYDFLCKEFGKANLVYVHLAKDKPIPAIHCIFVPIQSNQLLPQAFVGKLEQQEGYINRYQAVLDRLWEQGRPQNLQTGQATPARRDTSPQNHKPSAPTYNLHTSVNDLLESFKRNVNLGQFAMDKFGYRRNKDKSSKRSVALDHGKGTPRISVWNYQGIWFYKYLKGGQSTGTIVKFLREKGYKTDQNIIAAVSSSSANHVSNQQTDFSEPVQNPTLQQELARAKLDKFASIGVKTYLEKRGIEPATYHRMEGLNLNTNSQGAAFGLYAKVNIKGQGQLCSTIEYQLQANGSSKSKKYFQKDLPRGLSVLKPNQPIKEIFITESPIDALSHKQLQGTAHTLYLSTCGSIGKEIASSLEAVFIQAKEQSIGVKLGFDQDDPGRAMAQQVAAIASKQGITCQMEWPSIGKDWNDMLLASKKQAAQLDQPKHTTVFGRSL